MKKIIFSMAALASMNTTVMAGGDIAPVEPVIEVVEVSEAQTVQYAYGLKVGTLGVGIDFSIPLAESTNLRFNVNGLKYSYDTSKDGTNYNADLTLFTAGVLLDYYPVDESAFRLSLGAYYNGNNVKGKAKIDGTVTIYNTTYTASDIGGLGIDTDIDKFSPYAGIGWGSQVTNSGWSFTIDAGVLYQGTTKVTSNIEYGSAIPQALKDSIKSSVDAEVANINNDISDYKYYPVVMIGVNYAF